MVIRGPLNGTKAPIVHFRFHRVGCHCYQRAPSWRKTPAAYSRRSGGGDGEETRALHYSDLRVLDDLECSLSSPILKNITIDHGMVGIRECDQENSKQRRETPSSKTPITIESSTKRHVTMRSCPTTRINNSNNQIFDQEKSSQELARMIAIEECPLHIVEHPSFSTFIRNLQPRFKLPTSSLLESELLSIFQTEKQSLRLSLAGAPGRISLSVSLWTTAQTLGYVSLSGSFVGGDWNLRRKALSFTMVTSDTALGEVIRYVLADYEIQHKLLAVTLDSSHDGQPETLHSKFFLNDRVFIVRCYAQVLNTIAHDLLASIHGMVYSIREMIKHDKSEIVGVGLDVQARWDSTYMMIAGAAALQRKFPFWEGPTAAEDWNRVERVCGYLKLCYDSAMVLATAGVPTANLFFQEAWKMELELTRAAKVDFLAGEVFQKFDKFWKDCSLVMALAIVMDPRFKMKMVEFGFGKVYAGEAGKYVEMVNEAVRGLFSDYLAAEEREEAALTDFDVYMSAAGSNGESKSELDQYLEEALVPRADTGFEVLTWWKVNELKYPTLGKMARDLLAIQMSTVPMAEVFGGPGGSSRVLDEYRSSLKPETVEALVCTKDWLAVPPTATPLSTPAHGIVVKAEF